MTDYAKVQIGRRGGQSCSLAKAQAAKRIRPGIVGRCSVCKARQITVWKAEKGKGVKA